MNMQVSPQLSPSVEWIFVEWIFAVEHPAMPDRIRTALERTRMTLEG